jgi:transcriptional regulator with XRE-family HTH domain
VIFLKGYKNLKLKAAIAEVGCTQKDVANATRITPATLSKKINGLSSFEEPEMQLIADFLNKVVTDIFFNYEVTKRIT